MAAAIGTFYISSLASFVIANCNFLRNFVDFGTIDLASIAGGSTLLVDCLFDSNCSPAHPMGSTTAIKISGDFNTENTFISNRFINNTSLGTSSVSALSTTILLDINSTYISNFSNIFER